MVARTNTDLYKGTVRLNITYQYCLGRWTLTCGLLLEEAEVERALGGRRGPRGGGWGGAERADRWTLEVATSFSTVHVLTMKLPFTFRTLYC